MLAAERTRRTPRRQPQKWLIIIQSNGKRIKIKQPLHTVPTGTAQNEGKVNAQSETLHKNLAAQLKSIEISIFGSTCGCVLYFHGNE